MKNKQTSVSLKYIDSETYEKLKEIVGMKGMKKISKTDLFNFIFKDYIDMHSLEEYNNPYLIKAIQSNMDAIANRMEQHLGSRLFTILGENTINLNILTKIIFDFMNKYDNSPEAFLNLKKYREAAVNELREKPLRPLSYKSLLETEDSDS